MIGQYLSNTNESTTVLIFQKFLELNKAQMFSQNLTFLPLPNPFDTHMGSVCNPEHPFLKKGTIQPLNKILGFLV
jgi:hypothetical protein